MSSAADLAKASLDDKYTLERGRVFLTGTQALIRLMLLQRERDARSGLNTAGFVSGYRGSPLGGLDQALWRAQKHRSEEHTSELQSQSNLVCRLLLEKKKKKNITKLRQRLNK